MKKLQEKMKPGLSCELRVGAIARRADVVLNRDRYVAHEPAEIIRQPVQRHDDHVLEPARFHVDHSPIVGVRVAIRMTRRADGTGTADSGLFGNAVPA